MNLFLHYYYYCYCFSLIGNIVDIVLIWLGKLMKFTLHSHQLPVLRHLSEIRARRRTPQFCWDWKTRDQNSGPEATGILRTEYREWHLEIHLCVPWFWINNNCISQGKTQMWFLKKSKYQRALNWKAPETCKGFGKVPVWKNQK